MLRLYRQARQQSRPRLELNVAPAVSIRPDERRLKQALGSHQQRRRLGADRQQKVTLSADVEGDFLCIAASQTGVDTGAAHETDDTSFSTGGRAVGASLARSTTLRPCMALVTRHQIRLRSARSGPALAPISQGDLPLPLESQPDFAATPHRPEAGSGRTAARPWSSNIQSQRLAGMQPAGGWHCAAMAASRKLLRISFSLPG